MWKNGTGDEVPKALNWAYVINSDKAQLMDSKASSELRHQ